MNQIPIKIGPLALLLTVITICLTVMAILTFTTARADLTMAQKYAGSAQTRYELTQQGQEFLAQADETIAVGMPLSGMDDVKPTRNGISKVLEKDGYKLTITLADSGSTYKVSSWRLEKEWSEDTTLNIWQP